MSLNTFFSIHEQYLELIENKESTTYSDKIFTTKYNINKKEISLYYEKENNKISINALDEHGLNIIRNFYRTLNNKILYNKKIIITENEYNNFLAHIANILIDEDYYNKCCVCGIKLVTKYNKISCCENAECKKTFNCIVTDNIVTKSFYDYQVFNFIFECFSSVLQHPHYDTAMEKNIPIMEGVNNLADLKKIVPENIKKNDRTELYDKIEKSTNDIELISKIDKTTYGILKNILTGNYFSIYSMAIDFENIFRKKREMLYNILSINYSGLIENTFDNKENILFHGSSIYSWYMILKNGLVNLSNTKLMTNGAAYGQGIYLSNSLNFASEYSRSIDKYSRVIGVFLLNDDLEKYKKANNIYVVADCSKLILKSLIVSKNASFGAEATEIQKVLMYSKTESSIIKKSMSKLKNKRLTKEHEKLKTKEYVNSVNIINDTKWEIILKIRDNKKLKIKIIFNDYPAISPSIISNNITNIKSRIVNGNNVIDLDILDPNKWKITTKLTDIMENIIENC